MQTRHLSKSGFLLLIIIFSSLDTLASDNDRFSSISATGDVSSLTWASPVAPRMDTTKKPVSSPFNVQQEPHPVYSKTANIIANVAMASLVAFGKANFQSGTVDRSGAIGADPRYTTQPLTPNDVTLVQGHIR